MKTITLQLSKKDLLVLIVAVEAIENLRTIYKSDTTDCLERVLQQLKEHISSDDMEAFAG